MGKYSEKSRHLSETHTRTHTHKHTERRILRAVIPKKHTQTYSTAAGLQSRSAVRCTALKTSLLLFIHITLHLFPLEAAQKHSTTEPYSLPQLLVKLVLVCESRTGCRGHVAPLSLGFFYFDSSGGNVRAPFCAKMCVQSLKKKKKGPPSS